MEAIKNLWKATEGLFRDISTYFETGQRKTTVELISGAIGHGLRIATLLYIWVLVFNFAACTCTYGNEGCIHTTGSFVRNNQIIHVGSNTCFPPGMWSFQGALYTYAFFMIAGGLIGAVYGCANHAQIYAEKRRVKIQAAEDAIRAKMQAIDEAKRKIRHDYASAFRLEE